MKLDVRTSLLLLFSRHWFVERNSNSSNQVNDLIYHCCVWVKLHTTCRELILYIIKCVATISLRFKTFWANADSDESFMNGHHYYSYIHTAFSCGFASLHCIGHWIISSLQSLKGNGTIKKIFITATTGKLHIAPSFRKFGAIQLQIFDEWLWWFCWGSASA